MDKSKYWKDMYIAGSKAHLASSKSEELDIISSEKPIDFVNENYEDQLQLNFYSPLSIEHINSFGGEIITFMNEHNVMHNGITERVSEMLLGSLVSLKSYVFTLRFKKNNKLMGFMVAIPFSVNCQKSTLTTYLCVNRYIRNKGVAMMIIRKALLEAHALGILVSYYLVPTPFSKSALQLKRWMRPINVEGALSRGFEFEKPKRKGDRTNNRHKLKYAVLDLPKDVICKKVSDDKVLLEKTYEWLKNQLKTTGYFLWTPNDFDQWKSWCSAFDTFFVTYKGDAGLISVQCKEIYIPDSQSISNVAFIPFHMSERISNTEELPYFMFRSALNYANIKKQDALFCLQTGDMNDAVLEKNNAVQTQGHMYLDFYNTILDGFDPKKLYVPLL